MTPRDILIAAKAKIEDPERWCQGYFAFNMEGGKVDPRDFSAFRRCAFGAVIVASGGNILSAHSGESKQGDCLSRAAKEMGYDTPIRLNDESDHPTVMKMFDRAIELATEKETTDGERE